MITKITKLHGIGALHAPLASGALTLKQRTILYGENGRGKSTLVALLRTLTKGDASALRQRKTIKGTYEQTAQILINQQPYELRNYQWSQPFPGISIFDTTFINENVYSGAAVETDHRKNLFSFAIGERGVALAQRIDQLAEDIAEQRKVENGLRGVVQGHIKGVMSPEVFLKLQPPGADSGAEVVRRTQIRDAQRRASTLQSLQTLSPISFEGLSQVELQDILSRTLDTISADVEDRLRGHIESSHSNERWLAEGTAFNSGDSCPYCSQDISSSELVAAYKARFSEAYREYRESLKETLENLRKRLSAETLTAIKNVVDGNQSRLLQWGDFLNGVILEFPLDSTLASMRLAQTVLSALVEKKLGEPLEPLTMAGNQVSVLGSIDRVTTEIDDYNARQVGINERMRELRNSVASGNLASAEAAVEEMQNQIERHTPAAASDCNKWAEAISTRERLEREKAEARKQLDDYTPQVLGTYKNAINKHLEGCGTSFKITALKPVYTGGKPRFDYAIELLGVPVDLSNKAGAEVVFESALSQGDKSSLAFAFFLAQLEHDPKRGARIIVFDDPLSSLDSCRRRYTRLKIAEIAKEVAQLIVMTHEEATVADVAEHLGEKDCCLIMLKAQGNFSIFGTTSIDEITATTYAQYFNLLHHFLYQQDKPEEVAKVIRPYLEMNLRYRFPEEFGRESLGEMIGKIRSADTTRPLTRLKPVLAKLEEVNDFCVKHSHGDSALSNTEKLLPADLKPLVEAALELSRGFPA